MNNPLDKVIEIIGGQRALANAIGNGVKQGHVWNWLNITSDGIPARYVIPACSAISWQVTPHQLRPDLYPHPDDGLPDHLRSAA